MQIPGFYGREEELKWLHSLWDQATSRDADGKFIGGPRMAIVLSETGLGKTRLAQAFYQSLTMDPVWDPPDIDYWPDRFRFGEREMLVNPDLGDHESKGPPQFLWLATRWDSPDARNPKEVIGIVDLRDRLAAHVRIAQKLRDKWSRARTVIEKGLKLKGKKIGEDTAGDAAKEALETLGEAIPYGGLIAKAIKTGFSLVKEGISSSQAHRSVSEQIEKIRETASDLLLQDLHEVFGGFGSGGLVLPTILFLDDAQWIDQDTLKFVHRLWDVATQNSWPLLIVVTHWEREWNELTKLKDPERHDTLCRYKWTPGGEWRVLPDSDKNDLRAYLLSKFPGLTVAQEMLILEKAAGNFWTLVLNVGALESGIKKCFLNGDRSAALTKTGESYIKSWPSEREQRIEQRFRELDSEIKDILGWSSRAGQRFLREVVASFAANKTNSVQAETLRTIETCVTPLAILGAPSNNFREFRDRAFYNQGLKHFSDFLAATDEPDFIEVLRNTLTEWINRTFNEHGDRLERHAEVDDANVAPENSVAGLTPNDAHYLLALARKELPLPQNLDWSDARCVAALRTNLLAIELDARAGVLTTVRDLADRVRGIDWLTVPETLASSDFIEKTGEVFLSAAIYDLAEKLFNKVLDRRRAQPTENQPKLATSLNNLAELYREQGKYTDAEPLFKRSLQIRELALGPNHPDVATSLNNLAGLYREQGKYTDAEPLFKRALKIREVLFGEFDAALLPLLDGLTALYEAMGQNDKAAMFRDRAAEIRRRNGRT